MYYVCVITAVFHIPRSSTPPGFVSGLSIWANTTYVSLGDRLYMECRVPDRTTYITWAGPPYSDGCCYDNVQWAGCDGVICGYDRAPNPLMVSVLVEVVTETHFANWICRHDTSGVQESITKYVASSSTQLTLPTGVIRENEQVQFECTATGGDPAPKFVWYVDDVEGDVGGLVTMHLTRQEKTIQCAARQLPYKPEVPSGIETLDVKFPSLVNIKHSSTIYYVEETGNLYLLCEITDEGNPNNPSITWRNSNGQVGTELMLSINNIQRDQRGTYRCQADNGIYTTNDTLYIDVQYGPYIAPLDDRTVNETDKLVIRCEAIGNPDVITYIWVKDGSSDKLEQDLQFTSIDRNDAGIYTCRAQNTLTPNGNNNVTRFNLTEVVITVQYRPGSALLQKTFIKKIYSTLNITCAIDDTGVPPAQYRWMKNGVDTGQSGTVYCLSDIRIQDEASYTCIPYNVMGDGIADSTDVVVYDDPANIHDLPSVLEVNNTDDQFSVTCAFTAIPASTIKWYKDDNLLPTYILKAEYKTENDPHKESYTITTSSITWNSDDDMARKGAKGSYKCVAEHPYAAHPETREMELNVFYPPFGKPQLTASNAVLSVFDSFIFQCNLPPEAEGNPPSDQFHLYHLNYTKWTNTANIWTHKTDSVTYAGQYFCQAANMLGVTMASDNIELFIQAPAIIENSNAQGQEPIYDSGTFNLSCIGSGNNRNITWRRNDDDITKYFLPPEDEYVQGNYAYDQTIALKSVLRWIPPGPDANCNNIERHNGIYDSVVTAVMKDIITHQIASFTIKVQYPALWKGEGKTKITDLGRTDAFIYCDVCASPPPEQFTWSHSGHGLRDGILIDQDHIYFDEITSDDFGLYTCNAISTINGAKHERSFEIQLISAGSPEQPQLIQVLPNISSVSLSVTWTAGRNMGYEQYFKVEYKKHMDDDFQMAAENIPDNKNGESFTVTINNLKSATTYTIAVLAYNSWTGGVNYSTPALVTESTIDAPKVVIGDVSIGRGVVRLSWSLVKGNVSKLQLNVQGEDIGATYLTLRDFIPTSDNPILASHDALDPAKKYSFQLGYYEGGLTYTSNDDEVKWYRPPSGLSVLEIAGITVIILVCVSAVAGVIACLCRRRWFSRPKDIKSEAEHKPTEGLRPTPPSTPYENLPRAKPEIYEELSEDRVQQVVPASQYAALEVDQNVSNLERKVYEELPLESVSD